MWLNLTTWQAKPGLSIKSNVERIEAVKYIDICQVEMFLLSVSFLSVHLKSTTIKAYLFVIQNLLPSIIWYLKFMQSKKKKIMQFPILLYAELQLISIKYLVVFIHVTHILYIVNVNLITLYYYFPLKINRFNDVMYASATSCTLFFFWVVEKHTLYD